MITTLREGRIELVPHWVKVCGRRDTDGMGVDYKGFKSPGDARKDFDEWCEVCKGQEERCWKSERDKTPAKNPKYTPFVVPNPDARQVAVEHTEPTIPEKLTPGLPRDNVADGEKPAATNPEEKRIGVIVRREPLISMIT